MEFRREGLEVGVQGSGSGTDASRSLGNLKVHLWGYVKEKVRGYFRVQGL